jgi:hypothetical protein
MTDKKPLWRVMHDASSPGGGVGGFLLAKYARMLRALADEVAPEEPRPDFYVYTDMGLMENTAARHRWEHRMTTRAKLLKAADEAEGGTDG